VALTFKSDINDQYNCNKLESLAVVFHTSPQRIHPIKQHHVADLCTEGKRHSPQIARQTN